MSNFETENSFEYHHIDLNWGNKTNEQIRSITIGERIDDVTGTK